MKPKLIFKPMFYVTGWSTEIIKGYGAPCKYRKTLCEYDDVLFYPDGDLIPLMASKNEVFENYEKALIELERQKKDYKNYLIKLIDQSSMKLQNLKP